MAQLLRMPRAGFAALMGKVAVGLFQCRLGKCCMNMRIESRAQGAHIHQVVIVAREHLANIRREPIKGILHPFVAFLGAVPEGNHSVGRAFAVIGDLFDRLLGDCADFGIVVTGKRPERLKVPTVEQELPHHGHAKVAVWLFDQQEVVKIPCVAVVGECVGVASLAFALRGQPKPKLGLANQIKGSVCQRDVFLKRRGVAAPFRYPLPKNQSAVTHSNNASDAHIAPTSSGMSKKVGWR
mmetsp:Transcript_29281/g.56845  ORF Transcript_29281/g.56845 Transcript_29281/m.56845 type:complete len:239 (-) Transcript_29281:127-843(-)